VFLVEESGLPLGSLQSPAPVVLLKRIPNRSKILGVFADGTLGSWDLQVLTSKELKVQTFLKDLADCLRLSQDYLYLVEKLEKDWKQLETEIRNIFIDPMIDTYTQTTGEAQISAKDIWMMTLATGNAPFNLDSFFTQVFAQTTYPEIKEKGSDILCKLFAAFIEGVPELLTQISTRLCNWQFEFMRRQALFGVAFSNTRSHLKSIDDLIKFSQKLSKAVLTFQHGWIGFTKYVDVFVDRFDDSAESSDSRNHLDYFTHVNVTDLFHFFDSSLFDPSISVSIDEFKSLSNLFMEGLEKSKSLVYTYLSESFSFSWLDASLDLNRMELSSISEKELVLSAWSCDEQRGSFVSSAVDHMFPIRPLDASRVFHKVYAYRDNKCISIASKTESERTQYEICMCSLDERHGTLHLEVVQSLSCSFSDLSKVTFSCCVRGLGMLQESDSNIEIIDLEQSSDDEDE
jgi:hypothetical protein